MREVSKKLGWRKVVPGREQKHQYKTIDNLMRRSGAEMGDPMFGENAKALDCQHST